GRLGGAPRPPAAVVRRKAAGGRRVTGIRAVPLRRPGLRFTVPALETQRWTNARAAALARSRSCRHRRPRPHGRGGAHLYLARLSADAARPSHARFDEPPDDVPDRLPGAAGLWRGR